MARTRSGDFAAAHDKLDASLELRPRFPKAWAARVALLRAEGKYRESMAYVGEVVAEAEASGRLLDAERSLLFHEKALTLLAMGDTEAALVTVDALVVDDAPRLRERYLRARILALRKDGDAAITALDDAVEHGFLGVQQIRADQAFEFLAANERFVTILERVDAKMAENRRKLEQHLAEEKNRAVEPKTE